MIDESAQTTPTVFLLGSGFSICVTKGAMPGLGNFFDRLVPERYQSLQELVADVAGDVGTANVEEVIEVLDQFEDAPLSDLGGKIEKWKPQRGNLRSELAQYCLERLCPATWSDDHWAPCVLAAADTNTTVITTNYDNLAESILSHKVGATHGNNGATCHHCRMRRILLRDCECSDVANSDWPHWRGSVLKLHGSVAWKTCYNPQCCKYQCLVADQQCRPFDGLPCTNCGQTCQPVIVLPSHRKDYREFPHLRRMWDSAAQAIREASSLLVFGFSFSNSDSLVRLLVREAITKGNLNRVTILDTNPSIVADRLKTLAPSGRPIQIDQFQVPSDHTTPEWVTVVK
jgi:NAD-dependent SIR2 family protein deacetylase